MTMSTLTLSICSTEFSVPTNHFYAIEYSPYMAMNIFSRSRKKHRGNIFVFLHSISSKLKTSMLPVHLFVIYFPYFSFWCLFPMQKGTSYSFYILRKLPNSYFEMHIFFATLCELTYDKQNYRRKTIACLTRETHTHAE